MTDWNVGGWRARSRASALMYGTGAALAAVSLVPEQPATLNKAGILALAAVATGSAVTVLVLGARFSLRLAHVMTGLGSVLVAVGIALSGGTSLSVLYAMFFVWVAQYAAFFFSLRGALGQVTLAAAAHGLALAGVPPGQRFTAWAITAGTSYTVVVCYELVDRISARFRRLVEHSGGMVAIVDRDLTIRYHSDLVERVLGYQAGELVGTSLLALVHGDDTPEVRNVLNKASARQGFATNLECRIRHRDGSWVHAEASVENLFHDTRVGGLVLSIRDVTERKRLEQQLAHQALHDPLTDLANRTLFTDRVQHALARASRSGNPVAVLFLDLDDFKQINDTSGHGAGDELLIAVAGRLRDSVRTADTVARLGGDEFAVLVEDGALEEVGRLAQRLLEALSAPFPLDGTEAFVTASIGAAVSTDAGQAAAELLRNADAAMYQAKQSGKGRYARFQSTMHEELLRQLRLKTDLRHALERGELRLVYQPTVELQTGRMHGVEALVRWQHPSLGQVAPSEFIPIAEQSDLVVSIGRWVLRQACLQARQWREQRPDRLPLLIHVNISGRQLEAGGLVADVEAALDESGLAPDDLVLEITESVLVDDLDNARRGLDRVRQIGVRVAIDDFGTGYSSLNYLHRLPVDVIKIAKSFVDRLRHGPDDLALVHAIVQLGRHVGLRTVAEGIEEPAQATQLRRIACEFGQGYLFARPVDPEVISELLHTGELLPRGSAQLATR
ncbi:MAG TPA: EAL domain-containing protein [Egibacteraceae bacterium]|nr:EAL domain-containing protein [Egibacteraceae bacterium]